MADGLEELLVQVQCALSGSVYGQASAQSLDDLFGSFYEYTSWAEEMFKLLDESLYEASDGTKALTKEQIADEFLYAKMTLTNYD